MIGRMEKQPCFFFYVCMIGECDKDTIREKWKQKAVWVGCGRKDSICNGGSAKLT